MANLPMCSPYLCQTVTYTGIRSVHSTVGETVLPCYVVSLTTQSDSLIFALYHCQRGVISLPYCWQCPDRVLPPSLLYMEQPVSSIMPSVALNAALHDDVSAIIHT